MININDTLFAITDKYPETIAVFVANGFPHMDDPARRMQLGQRITLKQAVQVKGKNLDLFVEMLENVVKENSGNISHEGAETVTVAAALPCPVKSPIVEAVEELAEKLYKDNNLHLEAELQAASMGTEWMEGAMKSAASADELADLYLSAGFDTFFEEEKFGRFKKENLYCDAVKWPKFNESFADFELKDPAGHFSITAVVPAVFLVNTEMLGDEPIPKTWKDLFKPEYEGRVSLPVGDFDLFNSILLTIHKIYGDEGIIGLKRCMSKAMHPAEMVKSEKKKENETAITILPYFFTRMILPGSRMQAIWPEDGAIISPIFMATKKEKQEKMQPVADFFASKEVGEILSHKGLFPSCHPEVDNKLSPDKKFIWLGWDYIYENEIGALIKHCMETFNNY